MAQCCELVGKAYEGSDEAETKRWYAQAKGWYEKAQAAHPDDLSIARRLTEFFLQTNQMAEAEAQLEAILKPRREPPKRRNSRLGQADACLDARFLDRPSAGAPCIVHTGAGRSDRRG